MGPDRFGIVEDLSSLIAHRCGNIEDSKMAVLGGEFAAIMLVTMGEVSLNELENSLENLGTALNLRIEMKRTRKYETPRDGRPYFLEVVSMDTLGIVHAVSSVIKQHCINFENLETDTLPAPWTGTPMFRMRATLTLGPHVSVNNLRNDFAIIQQKFDWEINLKAAFKESL